MHFISFSESTYFVDNLMELFEIVVRKNMKNQINKNGDKLLFLLFICCAVFNIGAEEIAAIIVVWSLRSNNN